MNTKHFMEKLAEELDLLESELSKVGRPNPENPGDWEPTPEPMDITPSDMNDMGDAVEEAGTRVAIEGELENRLNEVKEALERIEHNTYGECEVCGEQIEEKRLEANPAARTCMKHMEA